MRIMVWASFLVNRRDYCETFLNSKRCPQSINNSERGLATQLSLCADLLISELSHLQRVEIFRKMIIRCQDHKLNDALLDPLAFLYERDYRIAIIEFEGMKCWLTATCVLLTYNGKWGIIDHSYYKGLMKPPQLSCKALRNNAQVIAIHQDLKELAAEAKEKLHLANYTIATELCETTLEEEGIIRVHCHLMLDVGLVVNLQFKIRSCWLHVGLCPLRLHQPCWFK